MHSENIINSLLRDYIAPLLREVIREEINYLKPFLENSSQKDEFLTAKESAEFLGDALQTFYGRTSKGELPTYGSGKKIFCKKSDLMAWLEKKRTKSISDLDEEVNDYLTNKSRKGRSLKMKST